jgi:hypothetical protein
MATLVEKMMEKGLIPPHLLEEAKEENPDSRIIDAAELLHSLLCTEEHGMDGGDCAYHAESMYPDPRKNPYHRRWITYTETLLSTYSLSLQELQALITEVIEINVILRNVADAYHGKALSILLDVIGARLPKPPPVQTAL